MVIFVATSSPREAQAAHMGPGHPASRKVLSSVSCFSEHPSKTGWKGWETLYWLRLAVLMLPKMNG